MDAKYLVEHAGREAAAMSFYLAMSYWADFQGYRGLARWAKQQSDEERGHMKDFLAYVNDFIGEKADAPAVKLIAFDAPNIFDALKQALDIELKVTGWISGLSEKACSEQDYTTAAWLNPYLRMQIDSVSEIRTLLSASKDSEDPTLLDSVLFPEYDPALAG